jgi:branched-subunit amino acid transport protein
MAVVTYLIRVLPFVLFRRKFKNKFILSFLHYTPYGVLSALIIPNIFYSSENLLSAILGAAVALILSYFEKGLLLVSVGAVVTVYITELIINYL